MNKSDTTSTIIPALIKARGAIKPAAKSGKNTFDRYDYATELDWHDAVMPALLTNGLTLSFSICETLNLADRTTKNGGTEHAVEVHGTATLMHESGEWIEVGVSGQGQDRADKAVYKAMTGAKKYGYACLFALPTSDDPERPQTPEVHPKPLTTPKPPTPSYPPRVQSVSTDQPPEYAGIIKQGLAFINQITSVDGANKCIVDLGTLAQAGSSKQDLWRELQNRARLNGVIFNQSTKQFEAKPGIRDEASVEDTY